MVVTASLDPEYFETVLRAALYAPDARATLVHGNGTVILSSPAQDAPAGLNLDLPGSMFHRHMQSGATATLQQGLLVGTQEHRLMAQRTIAPAGLHMDQPLVVRLSRASDAVLAPWRARLVEVAALLALAMVASAAWLTWHQRRRQLQDETERTAAEAEREGARRLAFGLRGADLGLWEWNLTDDTVTANARTMQMLGHPASDAPLPPAFWRGLLHLEDLPALEQAVAAHLEGQTPSYRLEHRYRHHDGHWVWVLVHAMVMERNAQGRALRVVGTHLDISERKHSQIALERLNDQLEALSLTDGLTGVVNRRGFDHALAAEWARGLRQQQPIALLMVDVDHFKLYNDRLGHPAGDACLRAVAQTLSACLRQPVEQLARYGGEEFAVLLVDADTAAGSRVAERCLAAIAAARLPHPCSPLGPILTLSIGVASLLPQADGMPAQLLQAADAALYAAKRQGRARQVAAPAPHATAQDAG